MCSSIKSVAIMCCGDELLDRLLSVYLDLQSFRLRKIRQPQPCIKRNNVGPSQIELATIGSLSIKKRKVYAQRLNWALSFSLSLCALKYGWWWMLVCQQQNKQTNKDNTPRGEGCSAMPRLLYSSFADHFWRFVCFLSVLTVTAVVDIYPRCITLLSFLSFSLFTPALLREGQFVLWWGF